VCRHLAYVGEPVRLGRLLIDPPHSLVVQSYRSRRQTHGAVNADGFGVGWYPQEYRDGQPDNADLRPARHRGAGPVWANETFADLCRVIHSSGALAAVHSATAGIAHGPAAPFRAGRWLFSHHLPADFEDTTLRRDVPEGLTARPKQLPPKWFYDKLGSELFEDITRLPEYYPTRAEQEILHDHAAELIALTGCDTLIELGSGSSQKTRLLLDAVTARPAAGQPGGARYVAVDVSENALRGAAVALRRRYPDLLIEIVRADFETQLQLLPSGGRRLMAFLGSTIGNFEPAARARFLAAVRSVLAPGDHFLLGADLVKPFEVLVPAYDDAAGVTAAFNLNLLDVLNRRLGADFDRTDFAHVAVWNADQEWIAALVRRRRESRNQGSATPASTPRTGSRMCRSGPIAADLDGRGARSFSWIATLVHWVIASAVSGSSSPSSSGRVTAIQMSSPSRPAAARSLVTVGSPVRG
jgi:L-histidine N-alpha-methyltransferase